MDLGVNSGETLFGDLIWQRNPSEDKVTYGLRTGIHGSLTFIFHMQEYIAKHGQTAGNKWGGEPPIEKT
jgi:hypothetical protein